MSDLLTRAQARGAVFSVLRRSQPWGLEFGGGRLLTIHVMLEGSGLLLCDAEPPVPLNANDVVLMSSGSSYRIASSRDVAAETIADARRRGDDPAAPGAAMILCGAYTLEGSAVSALLDGLPRPAIIRRAEQTPPQEAAIALLAAEADQDASGQQAVLDRLLDVNLVHALRTIWNRPNVSVPGWYRGLRDPRLCRLLTDLHERPEAPWQLTEMARVAQMSRSALAAAFAQVMGTPPSRYLTELRMQRAEDALVRSDETLAAIAESVGYANQYAFGNAFARTHGASPGKWRQAAIADNSLSSSETHARTGTAVTGTS